MTINQGARTAMRDRTLITTGAIGAVLAAICCMTPLLVVVFGAVGLTAWLAKADYVLIPALILCLALVAFGLYRRRLHHGWTGISDRRLRYRLHFRKNHGP